MKNKKNLFIYIPILVIVIFIIVGVKIFSMQNVQKGMNEPESNPAWNKVMADSANSKKIDLCVDGKQIDMHGMKLYMSENMQLMIPSDLVVDTFDCAQNLYNGEKLVVEKGSSKAVMYLGKNTLRFNDSDYRMVEKTEEKNGKIYIPASLFAEYLGYQYKWDSVENTAYFINEAKTDSFLPERYNYVEEKRISSVKNQGKYGTCWAFATLTALETTLMPEEEVDFSENNLVHNNQLSEDIQDGGDYIMSMAYLMSWNGPVLESADPYGNNSLITDADVIKHVQGAEIIPPKDYKQIKEKVYKYGGVESSMYMSMSNSHSTSVYYNSKEYAYCYRGDKKPNHDVVIIGWDDNYSKGKFNDTEIEGDGAFICMNSWGDDFGDNGVFYISYYDDRIGDNNVCYTDVEEPQNYDNIYQSDLCGWTGSMGFDGKTTAYFSNVYTAEENEKLKAVGFYAATGNMEYEVFVCKDYQGKKSLNNRNHVAAIGKIDNKGYYTIELDKGYNISKDEKFAVIVKISSKEKGAYKIIPVELESEETGSKIDLSDGEGYFSSEGYNWQSAEKQNCNICLKAYTK